MKHFDPARSRAGLRSLVRLAALGTVCVAGHAHAAEPTADDEVLVVEPGPWRPTLALAGNVLLVDGVDQWGGTLWAGLKYESCGVYVHARVGIDLGAEDARRTGLEGSVAGGYFAIPWFGVGLYGQVGQTSTDLADPWLERTWEVGLELSQCADDSVFPWLGKTQICVNERWAPVGQRFLRGVVIDERTYVLPMEDDPFMRWELALELRAGL